MGVRTSSAGKAIIHDVPQAASHLDANFEDGPTPLSELTKETRQVMTIDRNNGAMNGAQRAGNFGMPGTLACSFE